MNGKLDLNQLENVAGGQYDNTVEYLDKIVIRNGNLYNVNDLRQIVGTITAGQPIKLHPDALYPLDGHRYCFVKVNGADYAADRETISN